MDTFGFFIKEGTIIPIYNVGEDDNFRSSQDLKGKKFDLSCYLNKEGRAKGFLFLCNGETTSYLNGDYTLHILEYDGKEIKFT